MSEPVRVHEDGGVLVIELNRPAARNALDLAVATAVADAVDRLEDDSRILVGILTGNGGTFSAGMDLKAFAATGERPEVPGRGLCGLTQRPPAKPLIAAVEGYALAGGCELVLACDLVVSADDARFGLPEVTRGLIAGSGGLLRLPRRIPAQIAMEYVLTGKLMSAVDAHRWGLVNRLTEPGRALAEAMDLAAEIARNSPSAVLASKELLVRAAALPDDDAWTAQTVMLDRVLGGADAQEGARAFAEKRPPRWHTPTPTAD
jgi:enoyl-CoA hydratase